ncbi:MAG: hypothetical protein EXR50_07890 [Dehalococcoidia bacterium]|nr:hypothetical protein [Dehalococcoidia bacterium]
MQKDLDKDALVQFLIEGVHQRGVALERMLASFNTTRLPRHAIEAEFYRNYIMSLDDMVNWYHVLKEWQPEWKPLQLIFKEIQAQRQGRAAQFAAFTLEEVSRIDRTRLYEVLKLPSDGRLSELGWSRDRIEKHRDDMSIVLDRLCLGFKDRVLYGGVRADILTAFRKSGIIEDDPSDEGSFQEVELAEPPPGIEVVGAIPTRTYIIKIDKRNVLQIFSRINANCSILKALLLAFYDGQYGEDPIIPPVLGATTT